MSNTLHLSGDKWELSPSSLSLLQPRVIIEVIAPRLVPVKRNRRDALMLPRSHRSGDLTAVRYGYRTTDPKRSGIWCGHARLSNGINYVRGIDGASFCCAQASAQYTE
jgi:hypothetical protein